MTLLRLNALFWIVVLLGLGAWARLSHGQTVSCVTNDNTTTCYGSDGKITTCIRNGSTVTCY